MMTGCVGTRLRVNDHSTGIKKHAFSTVSTSRIMILERCLPLICILQSFQTTGTTAAHRLITCTWLAQGYLFGRCLLFSLNQSQQTRVIDPMCEQCWASVADAEPTLFTHWVNHSCLLGCDTQQFTVY